MDRKYKAMQKERVNTGVQGYHEVIKLHAKNKIETKGCLKGNSVDNAGIIIIV
jgi:hypothetical protein